MKPTPSDVHVDAILTNMSVQYRNLLEAFVADQIFAGVKVTKQSDKYFIFTKADWFRDEAQVRGPASAYVRGGYGLSSEGYFCDEFGIEHPVPDEVRENADQPLDPDRAGMQWITQTLLIRKERMFSADFWKTGVWGTDKVGTTDFVKWSDYAASDPAVDVDVGIAAIEAATGMRPNLFVLGALTYQKLKRHPDILDAFKYVERGVIREQHLADFFDVDKVLVARAIYNSAKEGAAAAVYGRILSDDDALLLYVTPQPAIEAASAGYTFYWLNEARGAVDRLMTIERYREEAIRADIVRGYFYADQKAVATDLGCFFSDAVD